MIVPEDREQPDGRTLRLFVTRVQPPGGPTYPDPMLVLGMDLAQEVDYGGIAPMAPRIGREVIMLDTRGMGFSEPSLNCPELDPVAATTTAALTDDQTARDAFLGAVQACHDRLIEAGVDLSAYGLEASAADVEDLRRVLDIPEWGVTTHGSASRLSLEYLRRYPQHIRVIVLDSPDFPQVDPFAEAIRGTREALGELFAACHQSRICSRTYPDLESSFGEALVQLDADPITIQTSTSTGERVEVAFDAVMFLRTVRQMLSEGHRLNGDITGFIDAARAGASARLARWLSEFAGDEAYCVGYLPKCEPAHPLFEGAFYSILCRDIVPFVDTQELVASTEGDTTFITAFADPPLLDVCEPWEVPPSDPEVASPVRSDVPTLIVLGRLDPFATRSIAEEASASFTTSFIVVDPAGDHNALPSPCLLSIRNAWVDAPTEAPAETGCLDERGPPPFL